MSKQRNDLDHLISLPPSEIEHRTAAALERVEGRQHRCTVENRDLTDREDELTRADTEELTALRAAAVCQQEIDTRSRAIGQASVENRSRDDGPPTLLVSQANIEAHAAALAEGRPYGAVETRSRMTAASDLGSAGAWAPGSPNEPRHLIPFAGIPVSPLTGRTATVPVYTGPTATVGVDELVPHPEYDDVAPANLTALRYGRWSEVSALADQVDELTGLNMMHSWAIARDLDALAVVAVEAAAASLGVGAGIEENVRTAILTVAAQTYSSESQLVIVGQPADLSELTNTTPANGPDVGSYAVAFGGARLYPSAMASPGVLTVFAPAAFRVFMAPLQSASLIDPTDGSHRFGSWVHSTGVACQIIGSAVTVGAS